MDPNKIVVKNPKLRNTKASLFAYPRNSILYRIYLWISGKHWWFIGFFAIVLFIMEAVDFRQHNWDFIHVLEFSIYISLLLVVGVLVDMLVTEIQLQNETRKILDFKHSLSLEFASYHDWDGLVDYITRFPSRIAPVRQACLLASDPISGQFNKVAEWNNTGEEWTDLLSDGEQKDCPAFDAASDVVFYPCGEKAAVETKTGEKFCLSFRYGGRVLGVLQFLLEPGETLNGIQTDFFENIVDEIAIALQKGQDRQAYYAMRSSETALAERREVSHYLHDHLGQSLGFLHIKLDQLIMEKDRLPVDKVFTDLEQMREAVNEFYEIVRGILETIHAETAPSLTNLLMEHARKISQRATFELDFKTRGKPLALPREVEQAIFYAFEESLSNAEKHAQASKIEILAEWGRDNFRLTISDDGVGFNPQSIDTDQHFGMEILNERMAKVNGRITLMTSENSGTTVNIQVPRPADGR